MKKTIITIAAVCAAATCLGACNSSRNNKTPYDHYGAIDEMFNASYSKINVTVVNSFEDDTLTSEYELNYSGDEISVSYSVQRLDISLDTGNATKSTVFGEAVIRNGEVISDDKGMLGELPKTKYSFKEEYFSNVNENLIDISLKADVTNPSGFMGTDFTCTEMKIDAEYFTAFNKMEITYKVEDGHSVKINYVFTV